MSTTNHTSEESGVWVSAAEAATRLGVHGRTIERRVAAGTMRSRRDAGGRVEVFVPGEPEGHAEGQGAQRVEEPDRQLVLGATALRALQGGIVEARADLAAARRMGMAGWIAATVVLVGASGTLVWGSWQWASERGALDLLAAEARAKAEAAERLADHLDSTVDEERARAAALDARLAAALDEQARLAAALTQAHERGDALRDDLAAALAAAEAARQDARQAERQAAGQRPASVWDWFAIQAPQGAIAGHLSDTAPGTDIDK